MSRHTADVGSQRSQSIIWMYWETLPGHTKPRYLDICLQTVQRWKGDLCLQLLDETTVRDFLPDVSPEVGELSLNHRSDYYRSRLVYRYGGLWLDADVIALRPLIELFDGLGPYHVALYGRTPSNLSANCFVARKDSPLLAEWMALQDQALDTLEEIPWNGLGKAPLVAAAERHEFQALPAERIAPLPWQEWKKLLSKWRSPARYLKADPVLFMLYNHFLHDAFGDMSESELLESDMLVSKLFRLALGYDKLSDAQLPGSYHPR